MATTSKTSTKPKATVTTVKKPAAKAAAKPVAPVSKVAAKSTVTKPAAAPKRATKKASTAASVSAEQRKHYVEMAAFYIAERRGFAPGNPMDDWLAAEAEIDRLLAGGHIG